MEIIQLVGHSQPVPIDSIVWLEGEANYTRVHYRDETISVVTQSLHRFEQFPSFMRVHRSAIVNPAYVQEFVCKKSRSGSVRLLNGQIIPVSRDRLELTAARLTMAKIPESPPDENQNDQSTVNVLTASVSAHLQDRKQNKAGEKRS